MMIREVRPGEKTGGLWANGARRGGQGECRVRDPIAKGRSEHYRVILKTKEQALGKEKNRRPPTVRQSRKGVVEPPLRKQGLGGKKISDFGQKANSPPYSSAHANPSRRSYCIGRRTVSSAALRGGGGALQKPSSGAPEGGEGGTCSAWRAKGGTGISSSQKCALGGQKTSEQRVGQDHGHCSKANHEARKIKSTTRSEKELTLPRAFRVIEVRRK